MNRGVDKRLSALEVKSELNRTGAELYARWPKNDHGSGFLQNLTDAELDALTRYVRSLLDQSRPDLASMTDDELEDYAKGLRRSDQDSRGGA